MFKTVPLQQYNTLRKAFGELQAAKKAGKNSPEYKAASRKAANAVTATLLSVAGLEAIEVLNQLWKNGMKGYRDDDDKLTVKSIAEKFARNAVGDLAGMTIFGSELADLLGNIIAGEKWYGIEIPGGEQLNDIIDELRGAAGTIRKLLDDGYDVVSQGGDLGEYFRHNGADYAGAVKEIAETAAMYLGGLPAENLEKYLTGPLRTVAPELYVAMQDLFDTPTKSDLKGLKGKALETRVGDVLGNRFGKMPEGAAAELARLYAEYGGAVIPPDTPTSVIIGGEEFALDAAARQNYDKAYTEAAKSALAGLRTNRDYQAMDDEERAAYLKKVYDAAREYARLETVPEYAEANPDIKAKYDALEDAGLSAARIVEVMAMKSALSSVEFADWIENAGFPGKTLEKVEDALNVSTATYDDFKAAGMTLDDIVSVTMALSELEPKAGEKAVTRYQKLHAVLDGDFTGKVKDQAMKAVLTEDEYDGYLAAKRYGIEGQFVNALEIKNNAEGRKDENGETIDGSKKYETMRQICRMKLPDNQKVALIEGVGYDMGGYRDYCWWMDLDDFVTRMESINDFHEIKDESGKALVKRKDQVIEYINALPLENDQKSALYVAAGYKPSTLDDCPWWKKWDIKGPCYPAG